MKMIQKALVAIFFAGAGCLASAQEISFTAEQVDRGRELYVSMCQVCHGTNLDNGQFATPIKGFFFANKWGGKSLGELARFTWEQMPEGNGKSLNVNQYIDALAFILNQNGFEAGDTPMSENFEELDPITLDLSP